MLDIIIPAYNAKDTLDRALKSLSMQSVADIMYVTVVDDFSDDDYSEIIKAHEKDFRQLTHIRLDSNSGSGVARRIGMTNATQPFIAFLDADDMFFDVYSVERMFNAISADDSCVVLCGDFLEQKQNGELYPHANDMIWCFSKIYRRAFLDKYDIRFNDTRCNEDAGLNTKIVLSKSDEECVKAINEPTYIWTFNKNGITKVNGYAYAFTNGISGYVENKIEAFNFVIESAKRTRHMYATLMHLYITYTMASWVREEYLMNVFNESKKFTDYMFKEPITMRELAHNLVQHKKELEQLMVLPKISIFDFLILLGVEVTNKE